MVVAAQQRRTRDRSAEVLDAARQLFFERGYRGTTIQQIAERAGYSKRTVYLDYRNKDELFVSVCAEGGELLLRKLRQVPHARLSVADCLSRYTDVFLRFSREQQPYFRMIFGEATPAIIGSCSAEVQQRLASLERACLGVIVDLTERAIRQRHIRRVDPWETAGIFVGTATGIVLLSMGGSQTVFSQQNLEALVHKAIMTFWAGLGGTPPGSALTARSEED